VEWAEGEWLVFDDHVLHQAQNSGETARYVLHLTFPFPPTDIHNSSTTNDGDHDGASGANGKATPATNAAAVRSNSNSSAVLTVVASAFELTVFSNCSVQTTVTGTPQPSASATSALVPLLFLYNRVADNMAVDTDPCIMAELVADGSAGGGGSALASSGVVRVTAAHGYGWVDVALTAGSPSLAWVTLELVNMSQWHADPIETHVAFGDFGTGLLSPGSYQPSNAKFQGYKGIPGKEPWSTGFLTLSSWWSSSNLIMCVTGCGLVHTVGFKTLRFDHARGGRVGWCMLLGPGLSILIRLWVGFLICLAGHLQVRVLTLLACAITSRC
jgi:hypothetical protein